MQLSLKELYRQLPFNELYLNISYFIVNPLPTCGVHLLHAVGKLQPGTRSA